ncbi:MAG TPA: hypothetical protein VK937_15290 [Candidatus Limnocylindria bacterium]|jgi:hypothetical protein|nr:hypothetical protein [Candidatus Limnocylindria bacterium]
MKPRTTFLLDSKTFSKQLVLLLVLLLEVTLVWAADKPWKTKPLQQWDQKELQTILTDSPWVRMTTVQRTWLPVSEKDVAPDPQINGGVRQMPPAGGQAGGSANIRAGEGSWRELNVFIYWQSSRVMRAATARQAVLRGEKVDVEKYASEPQSEYQIILRMEDMTPFVQHNEEFFKSSAFLQMKKGKSKISPSHVLYERNQKGLIQDAVFFFPKTGPSGPAVSGDETEVQFSCKIADSTVRADFKPREMADQSGPDL